MPAPTLPVTTGLVTRYHSGTGVFSDTGATTPATDGGAVALWRDQVGTAHLTVKDGANAPTYESASRYHSAPAVEFLATSTQALANATWNHSAGVAAGTMVAFFQRDRTLARAGDRQPDAQRPGADGRGGGLQAGFNSQATRYGSAPSFGFHGQLAIVRFDGTGDRRGPAPAPGEQGRPHADLHGDDGRDHAERWPPGSASGCSITTGPGRATRPAASSRSSTTREPSPTPNASQLEAYAAQHYYPPGTSKVQCIGDSKTRGYPLHTADGQNYPTKLAGLLPAGWTTHERAMVAYTTQQVHATFTPGPGADRDEWRDADVLIWMTGTNDAAQDFDPADSIAALQAAVAANQEAGFRVIVATTDRFNIEGATPSMEQATVDAFLADFNGAIRAGDSGADAVVDVAAAEAFSDFTNSFLRARQRPLDGAAGAQ